MDPEILQALVQEANDVRWLIHYYDGMASKSVIEDVLMLRHGWLDRDAAHELMNYIEYHNIMPRPLERYRFSVDKPPTLTQYPEVRLVDIRYIRLPEELS